MNKKGGGGIDINIVIQDLKIKRSCRCKKFTLNHNKQVLKDEFEH